MERLSGASLPIFCCLSPFMVSCASFASRNYFRCAKRRAAYGREPEFSRKARGQKSRKWHIERASESQSVQQVRKGSEPAELVVRRWLQFASTRTFEKSLPTESEAAKANCKCKRDSGFGVGERRVCDYEGGISVTESIAWTV